MVTDSLSRRHSKSRMAEQPFVRMAAGQAKFLSGFSLEKTRCLEEDRITAKTMRDVNKVDALFVSEIPEDSIFFGKFEWNPLVFAVINRLEIVLTMRSPSPRPLPRAGGEVKGEGASVSIQLCDP